MLTFNDQIDAIRRKIADIAIARVYGQSYALPVWSVDYPSIPADLVDTLLASFNVPSMAALEAELVASQAAATGVDVSRGIDATSVVTAPAAPSDTVSTAPVVTQPIVTQPVVTQPVVTQPAAGGGAALLLALASYYFFGA